MPSDQPAEDHRQDAEDVSLACPEPPRTACHAPLGEMRSPTTGKPAEIREKRPRVSRMESLGPQSRVTHGSPPDVDLKAFRREARRLSTAELRDRYKGEASSHAHMLDRARRREAVVHPAYRKFKPFLLDMGPAPDPTFSIDRRNNNNPMYGPRLCVWRSPKDQARNRSTTNRLTDLDGRTMTLPEWAEKTGTDPATMRKRVEREWPDHEVIHGRGAASAPAVETQPVAPSHWPPTFRKTPTWDRAFGRFEEAFSPIGPATRAVMVAWFAGPHLDRHEAAYDRDHGWDRAPDEVDHAGPILRNLRIAMAWARQGMTREERVFIGYLDSLPGRLRALEGHVEALHPVEVDQEDREELTRLRNLVMVAEVVKRTLPAPPAPRPATIQAERPVVMVARPMPNPNPAAQAREAERLARHEAHRSRLAGLHARGVPRFEDLDTPFPSTFGLFGLDPNDPEVIAARARKAMASSSIEDDDPDD